MTRIALTLGVSGVLVRGLHEKLCKSGLQIPPIELERELFGPGTLHALREWQRANGLVPTGVIDEPSAHVFEHGVLGSLERGAHAIFQWLSPATGGGRDEPGHDDGGGGEHGGGGEPGGGPDEPPKEFEFLVRGQVMYRDGLPLSGVLVRAFDKDLRSEQRLAKSTTDASGNFELWYSADAFRRPDKRNANLVVRAYERAKPEEAIAESRVIYNAQTVEKVRLQVKGGPQHVWSEYEQLITELAPELEGTALDSLEETMERPDVTHLSGRTGQAPQRIAALVVAHKLAARSDIPAEVFYGLARMGLVTNLSSLLAQGSEVLRRAIEAGIAGRLIPGRYAEHVDELHAAMGKAAVRYAIEGSGAPGRSSLGDLLATAVPDAGVRETFLNEVVAHRGSTPELWTKLAADPALKDDVASLQLALQLAALTDGHVPLMRELQRMRAAGEIDSLRDLARFDQARWQEIVGHSHGSTEARVPPSIPGDSDDAKVALYAATIRRILDDVLPTETVAYRAQADNAVPRAAKALLLNVAKQDGAFDLLRTNLRAAIADKPVLLEGVDDHGLAISTVQAMQRVFRVVPRYEAMMTLRAAGFDSAIEIAAFDRETFVTRFADTLGGRAQAQASYNLSAQTAASALSILANASPTVNNLALAVLSSTSAQKIPDLETLFGSLDLCACSECRSVFSPAAYLAELLAFLHERPIVRNGLPTNGRDILFGRRRDLGDIELTCVNTNVPLPYVDIVNELLEDAVAQFTEFDLAGGLAVDLDTRTFSPAVRAAFAAHGIALDVTRTRVVVVAASSRWFVSDHSVLYPVEKQANGSLRVTSAAYQTDASAAALAANPQHQNDEAYEQLRGAIFPWSLPFDLPWEESRAYLSHLRIGREELVEDFASAARAEALTNLDLATETLGMLPLERDLIVGGRAARLATTAALAATADGAMVDGVAPAALDVVLVKDQGAAVNGLYVTGAGNWALAPSRAAYVSVAEGAALAGTRWLLVRGSVTRVNAWDPWGLHEVGNVFEVFDPAHPDTPMVAALSWLDALAQVRVMLARAGLSYAELIAVLETRFVNPGAAITIVSADVNDSTTCDTGKLVLHGLAATAADRLHRFVRLWRRLGWTAREVDRAVSAFGGAIDASLVRHLAQVARLRAITSLPVDAILAFWTTIETLGEDPPPLYRRLFQDPTVIQPLDPAFALAGAELAIVAAAPADALISHHASTILAALGITASELSLLVARLGNDNLTLANLSWLFRHAQLAQAAGLAIDELVMLLSLSGIDPFDAAHTENAVLCFDVVDAIRSSGLTVATLDYLLRHRFSASSELAPSEAAIADQLDQLRRTLQRIADDASAQADPAGDVTRRRLAQLLWPADLIAQVIEALAGRAAFDAPLAALPVGIAIPAVLAPRLTFDAATGRLRIAGPLTNDERTDLRNASVDGAWRTAIDAIHAAPRSFVTRRMKAYVWPVFSTPLAALPAGLMFPPQVRNRILHDATAGALRFTGVMTDAERVVLRALSADVAWLAAVEALAAAPDSYVPPVDFLGGGDATALFDAVVAPEARFARVLGKLLTYLQATWSSQAVVRFLSESLSLEGRAVEELITRQVRAVGTLGAKAIADFLDPAYATSHTSVRLTAAAFPSQYQAFIRLQKAASILSSLKLTSGQLAWLADLGPTVPARQVPWVHVVRTVRWLAFDDLPVAEIADGSAAFASWLRLVDLGRLRDELPRGEQMLSSVFALARTVGITGAQLWAEIASRTSWSIADIASAAARLGLDVPGAFRDETGLSRLRAAMRRVRQLGVSADRCRDWARAEVSADDARAVRNAVKAKYSETEWLGVAKPLRDVLREKQRSSLVAYLIARPDPALGRTWQDVDGLYAHFLIDVQMAPCMVTSRIKQALSSVQLFVQRTLLNLEQDRGMVANVHSDAAWSQWRWMKSYRLWEANRKVFLYPENWIEPELRHDKTTLFKGLESALLQGNVDQELAADAFMTYLEGLDTTARLEVAGMYQQDAIADQPAVLHVLARTLDATPAHFYRRRVAEGRWTEWERVEVDISEKQVLPIIWSSRLFLLWPEFTETQDPQPIGDKPTAVTRRWQIQIAWTERRHGRWSAKKITPQKIQSNLQPDEGRADRGKSLHTLRAAFDGPGLRVWYEYDVPERTVVVGPRPGYYGGTRKVREATVKGWHFTGCDGRIDVFDRIINGVFPPTGSRLDGMFFTEVPSSPLILPKARGGKTEDVVLASTPGTFSLAYAYQDGAITARRPFFYQDSIKSFFVTPEDVTVITGSWSSPWRAHPGAIDLVHRAYYTPLPKAKLPHPGPRPGLIDPVPIERHRVEVRRVARDARFAAHAAHDAARVAVPTDAVNVDRVPAVVAAPAAPIVSRALAIRAAKGLTASKGTYVLARGDKQRLKLKDYIDDSRIFAQVWTYPIARIEMRYRFWTFYHPYVCNLIKELNWHGLDGFFGRDLQLESVAVFKPRYAPTALVDKGDPATENRYPVEDVDFTPQGAYSQYNWELFFHAPLLIATRLMHNQRFEDAQAWFHYIFDPTDTSGQPVPQKYWRTRPFFEETKAGYQKERIERLVELAARGISDQALDAQIREWRANPFDPHVIASLRTTAYQKAVVMKYLDNLIAWGDQLFRRNTIESINEATQLYVLAAEILGRKPAQIAPRAEAIVHTYTSLDPELRRLSNRLVEIEQVLPPPHPDSVVVPSDAPPLSIPKMLYFCVPPNDKLLGYWRTVADRLTKIRHCMNIEGVVQRLPLFEPPIDPALLVRAAAAGIDLTTALSDIDVALPIYRFRVLSLKATELTQEVKSLGASLLSALEKRDAEEVAAIRAQHEAAILDVMTAERKRRLAESTQNVAGLRAQRRLAEARYVNYQKLLGVTSPSVPGEGQPIPDVAPGVAPTIQSEDGIKLTQYERQELTKLDDANSDAHTAADWEFVSALLSIIPTLSLSVMPWGLGGSVSFGGSNLAGISNGFANRARASSVSYQHEASRAARLATYLVRENDWALQSNLAGREMMQIDAQILSALLREQIGQNELDTHLKRIEQAKVIEEFLRDKYTNRDLYDWMVGQVSDVFFQAYQLAYDVAKRTEQAYRFELGLGDSNFVQFGYWDSLKKGLLCGERLLLDLKRMEVEYVEQNRREYELTKHISLALLHPEALVSMQERGTCTVELPEAIFDIDNPGHYMRRLRSVALSIPCVAGPYTTVSCKLTLLGSRIRKDTTVTPAYASTGPDDRRFANGSGGVQAVVTSSGRDDTGTFELDMRDDRYQPFEGTGAVSTWRLELPSDFRQFDYRTIVDVVLRLRYTARDGGEPLKLAALGQLGNALKQMELEEGKRGLYRLFSLRHDFPDDWYRFLNPPAGGGAVGLSVRLPLDRFPMALQGRPLKVQRVALFGQLGTGVVYDDTDRLTLSLRAPGRAATPVELAVVDTTLAGLPAGAVGLGGGVTVSADDAAATWVIQATALPAALTKVVDGVARLDPDKLFDVGMLCQLTF